MEAMRVQNMLRDSRVCVICNLQSQSGRRLNERIGEVMALDEESGRLCVRLSPSDRKCAWKKVWPMNVRMCDPESIRDLCPLGPRPGWAVFDISYLSSWFPTRGRICDVFVDLEEGEFDMYPIYSNQLWLGARRTIGTAILHIDAGSLEVVTMKVEAMLKAMTLLSSDPDVIFLGYANFDVEKPSVNDMDMPNPCDISRIIKKLEWIRCQLLTAFVFGKCMPSLARGSLPSMALDAARIATVEELPVIQEVNHQDELAAERDATLLEEQARYDWADGVERLIEKDAGSSSGSSELEQIFLYPYTRTPRAFMDALMDGPDLKPIREAMAENKCPYVLAGGAKIFVWPQQYETVLHELNEKGIKPLSSNVIAAESVLPFLEASIATISSQKNVRVKKDGIVALTSAPKTPPNSTDHRAERTSSDEPSNDEDWEYIFTVERTFICSTRVTRSAQSVNQSTTEAHGGFNPRRMVV